MEQKANLLETTSASQSPFSGQGSFPLLEKGHSVSLYLQGLILFILQDQEGGKIDVHTVLIIFLFMFDV